MPAPLVIALLILAAIGAVAFALQRPAVALMVAAAVGVAHVQFGVEAPPSVRGAVARAIHPAKDLHDHQVEVGTSFGCHTASDPDGSTRALAGVGCR